MKWLFGKYLLGGLFYIQVFLLIPVKGFVGQTWTKSVVTETSPEGFQFSLEVFFFLPFCWHSPSPLWSYPRTYYRQLGSFF